MSRLPLRHTDATRWANIMLGAAVVASAACLVVFILPRQRVEIPEPAADTSIGAPEATARTRPTEGVAMNWSRVGPIGERLNAPPVREWTKEQERLRAEASTTEGGEGQESGEPATSVGGFAPPWRYIGAVIDGERRTALVAIPEPNAPARQRFIAEGFTRDDYRLVTILPEKIVVEQGRTRHEIPLAESKRGTGITVGSTVPPMRFMPTQAPGMVDRGRGAAGAPGAPGRVTPPAPGATPGQPGQPPVAAPNPVPTHDPSEDR